MTLSTEQMETDLHALRGLIEQLKLENKKFKDALFIAEATLKDIADIEFPKSPGVDSAREALLKIEELKRQ